MKYQKLGSTGLDVSPICVGCMGFGSPERGYPAWTVSEEESLPVIRAAIEGGINFFDTANVYSAGHSEEILGKALSLYANRADVVIATKVLAQMRPGAPNGGGLSRKAIFDEVDASLRRLNVDYIDLYQTHGVDVAVPMEETLEAFNDLVRSGKVRYIGASSMIGWEFGAALNVQERNGWARFSSIQAHYNLINREDERELHPLCLAKGVGVIPWSPLARGRLTRDWDAPSERSSVDAFGDRLYSFSEGDRDVVGAVASIAKARGVSRAEIALAWFASKDAVTAPIVGVHSVRHVNDALAALEITLDEEELAQVEGPYVPHPPAGVAGSAKWSSI